MKLTVLDGNYPPRFGPHQGARLCMFRITGNFWMMSAMDALLALEFCAAAAYPGQARRAGIAKWEAIFARRHVPAGCSLCTVLNAASARLPVQMQASDTRVPGRATTEWCHARQLSE